MHPPPPQSLTAVPLDGGWAGDDTFTLTEALYDGPTRAGTATVTCSFPDGARQSTCTAAFALTDGGTLMAVFAPEDTWSGSRFSVLGGTGTHAGATGSGTWNVPGQPVGRGLVTMHVTP